MPTFYQDDGTLINITTNGCLESDFDQYGDMDGLGTHPEWQRQLAKSASARDRLREWKPEVMNKLQVLSCMVITALDIDAIRIEKASQVTLDALADWTTSTRSCAKALGKNNFYITGEVIDGNTFGSLYL
jgi:alpha-1,3-glucan synthase